MEQLSLEAKILLDAMLNIGDVYSPDYLLESVVILTGKSSSDALEVWNKMTQEGIVFQKDYKWLISQNYVEKIKEAIQGHLSENGIVADRVADVIEGEIQRSPEKISIFVKLLGGIYKSEGKKSIIFVDGEWCSDLGNLCDELVKKRMAFRSSSSSRKHSYRSFYLRIWPFDVEEIIRSIILKHLNIEGLTDEEWSIISLLLLSRDLSLEYQVIKNNVNLTDPEIREFITNLKERGLITEEYGKVALSQGLKEPLTQYFKVTFYQKFKSKIISQLKQRIGSSLSILWIFTTAKVIYDLPYGEIKVEPILLKTISKTHIKEFENQLANIKDIGILYDLGSDVVLLGDIMRDVENWLKSSIKQSLIFIPARDYYLARSVFQDIFSKCQEYVKIQDPYLGEETFDLLEYIPVELQIMILTGLKLGEGEDLSRICQRIERMRTQRRGKFQILFIGDKTTGDAPFHDRFIISKTRGWQVGTSLKQVGKGKETTISELSKGEKDETIEPAFDHWWNAKASELKLRNIEKVGYQEWKENIIKRGEI
jgi:hypothetical protein